MSGNWWELAWAVLNSPVGVSVVSAIMLWLLGHLWKVKPKWERIYDQHRGTFLQAVRHAEEQGEKLGLLPDARMSAAVEYMKKLGAATSSTKTQDLVLGLERALEVLQAKNKTTDGGGEE